MSDDRITELYEGQIGSSDSQLLTRQRIHWLCAQVRGERVLDIGCSQGIASILLGREGRRVVGLDVDAEALEYARARLEEEPQAVRDRVRFIEADAGGLEFADSSFDAVLLGEVVEHLIDPGRVVAEAARVLAPGGRLALTTPYGPFRYPDHKEPIYLGSLLEVLLASLRPVEIELLDRYLAIAATRSSEPADAALWRRALEVAEERLRDRDHRLEATRGSLRRRLDDERRFEEQLASLRLELDRANEAVQASRMERHAAIEAQRSTGEELAAAAAERDALERRADWMATRVAALEDHTRRLERELESRARQVGELMGSRSVLGALVDRVRSARQATGPAHRGWRALRAGEHATARRLAGEALQHDPDDPVARFVDAAARWESGDTAVAGEIESAVGDAASETDLETGARFHRHVEELPRAAELLGRMELPARALVVDVARALNARGHARLAVDAAGRGLELYPGDEVLAEVREQATGMLRVLEDGPSGDSVERRLPAPAADRVLHLLERSLPHHVSGGTVRSHNTVRAQRRAGIDAQAMTQLGFPWMAGIQGARPYESVEEVPYYHLNSPNGRPDRLDAMLEENVEAASEVVEMVRPAILHPASDYVNALVALRLRDRFGIPVVYEVRGFPEERLVVRPGSRARMDPHVARRELELRCWLEADRLVTLAGVMKEHMVSRGVPAEKVVVIPNAVDTRAFAPSPRDPAFAERAGIAEGDVVLGYVSTLNGYEGVEYLIEATKELIDRGHPARALIVGDGPARSSLEARAAELGLERQVSFTGRIGHFDVPAAYSVIDLFVVPRTAEATCQLVTPLKPYEAMAAGIPVVVSGTRALREMILDGEVGLWFEPEDATSLADVAEPLVADGARRADAGRRVREWVASERTWDHNAALYAPLYRELAG